MPRRASEYREQLEQFADALPIGVVAIAGNRIRYINDTACRQFGRDGATIPVLAPARLFADEDAASRVLADAVAFDDSLPLRRRDGSGFNARVRARTLAVGARQFRLLLIDDLTEDELVHAQLAQQHEELQAMARRLITLQEDERLALSRELHDDVGQAITAIKLCAMSLQPESDDALREAMVAEIIDTADQTIAKLRNLSLLLRPPQLDALGLEAALRWHAGRMFRSGRPALALALAPLPERPDPTVELACFRIAQEALTNVLRHARASHVSVALEADAGDLTLTVHDDGHGFDRDQVQGLGLVTMRERAQQVGGSLEIDSSSGEGTRIQVRLPMPRDTGQELSRDPGLDPAHRHLREGGNPMTSKA